MRRLGLSRFLNRPDPNLPGFFSLLRCYCTVHYFALFTKRNRLRNLKLDNRFLMVDIGLY